MMSSFGGYVGVGDCPLDTTAYLYTQSSPYDMGNVYDGAYNGECFICKSPPRPPWAASHDLCAFALFHVTRLGPAEAGQRYPDVV
jgi:hypothetical protein